MRSPFDALRDDTLKLEELCEIWRQRSKDQWADRADAYLTIGERFSREGEQLLAHDVLREGHDLFPGDPRILNRLALVLADLHLPLLALERATELHTLAGKLGGTGTTDFLMLLGRIHTDLATRNGSAESSPREHRQHARKFLLQAAARAEEQGHPDRQCEAAMRAATIAAVDGDWEAVHSIARPIRSICARLLTPRRKGDERYRVLVTLGEAAALLRDLQAAEDHWAEAAALDPAGFRRLGETRRRGELILDLLQADHAPLDRCFPKPVIAIFAGHMIDHPDREELRFPPSLEPRVALEVGQWIEEQNAVIGFSSAACGSDIIFLEQMLRRRRRRPGIELHVVLATNEAKFLATSVESIDPRGRWGERYRVAMKDVTSKRISSRESTLGDPVAYEYCNRMIAGLAILTSEKVNGVVKPLVVWNGGRGDGPGGTASVYHNLESIDRTPDVVPINELADAVRVKRPPIPRGWDPKAAAVKETPLPPGFTQRIATMLFADVEHYSEIKNDRVPKFVETFMGLVREELSAWGVRILQQATWGDAVYLVFGSAIDAGCAALLLQRRLAQERWAEHELPAQLRLRIALHTGPVHHCIDPVTGTRGYTGAHVNLAARIEPVVMAGEVFASEAFATCAASEGATEFRCEYLGIRDLPKGYGTYPVYLVMSDRPDGLMARKLQPAPPRRRPARRRP